MAAIASWLAATAAAATLSSMQGGRELQSGFIPSAPTPPLSSFSQQLMYGQLNTTTGGAYTVLVSGANLCCHARQQCQRNVLLQGTRRINIQFDAKSGAPAYAHMHLGFDPYVATSQYGFLQDVLGVSAALLRL